MVVPLSRTGGQHYDTIVRGGGFGDFSISFTYTCNIFGAAPAASAPKVEKPEKPLPWSYSPTLFAGASTEATVAMSPSTPRTAMRHIMSSDAPRTAAEMKEILKPELWEAGQLEPMGFRRSGFMSARRTHDARIWKDRRDNSPTRRGKDDDKLKAALTARSGHLVSPRGRGDRVLPYGAEANPFLSGTLLPKPSTEDEFIRDVSRAVKGIRVTQRLGQCGAQVK